MIRAMTSSKIRAAVMSSAVLLSGCAEFNQPSVGGGTATLICDNGKTFTVTYENGFETAIVESEGRRVELTKVRTTLGQTPTPPLPSSLNASDTAFSTPSVRIAPATGTTGIRYSDGDNLLLSRGRYSTLELDGTIYSNCETPK